MAGKKTDRKTDQTGERATRKPGKQKSGWVKVGVYLSPDAARRLDYATIGKGEDRSTILDNLVLAHLPNYVLSRRAASPVSELPDVGEGDAAA